MAPDETSRARNARNQGDPNGEPNRDLSRGARLKEEVTNVTRPASHFKNRR